MTGILRDGRTLLNDFVGGGRIVQRPRRLMTDEYAFKRALWLENHGRREEAAQFLDEYFQGRPELILH
jgi:hypothetical protein